MSRLVILLASIAMLHLATAGAATPAAALRATYHELQPGLRDNSYGKPLHLDSREDRSELKGDVYALVDHPFELVRQALGDPDGWCDVLILQFNTKRCDAIGNQAPVLVVNVGRKNDQPLEKTARLEFPFRLAPAGHDYFSVSLDAAVGPYGTRDYRIVLEAIPLDKGSTFVHLSYSYGFGVTAKLAMQTYLATTGRSKVGFTEIGREGNGEPIHVGGVRGMIERNTMRYYLAIETYLGSLSAPAGARVEKRLSDWFGAIERYPRQLHEMEREDYLAMKRKEIRRQQG